MHLGLQLSRKGEGTNIHEKLNGEAIKGITKSTAEEDEEWQRDLVLKLNRKNVNQCKNTILITTLRKAAEKYHSLYDKNKAKTFKQDRDEKGQTLSY